MAGVCLKGDSEHMLWGFAPDCEWSECTTLLVFRWTWSPAVCLYPRRLWVCEKPAVTLQAMCGQPGRVGLWGKRLCCVSPPSAFTVWPTPLWTSSRTSPSQCRMELSSVSALPVLHWSACQCVCVCVCMCVSVSVSECVCVSPCVCEWMSACMWVCVCVLVSVSLWTRYQC